MEAKKSTGIWGTQLEWAVWWFSGLTLTPINSQRFTSIPNWGRSSVIPTSENDVTICNGRPDIEGFTRGSFDITCPLWSYSKNTKPLPVPCPFVCPGLLFLSPCSDPNHPTPKLSIIFLDTRPFTFRMAEFTARGTAPALLSVMIAAPVFRP